MWRQQLEILYHRNGIAYAMIRDCLLEHRSIMGKSADALLVEGEHVSIGTERDLPLADFFHLAGDDGGTRVTNGLKRAITGANNVS